MFWSFVDGSNRGVAARAGSLRVVERAIFPPLLKNTFEERKGNLFNQEAKEIDRVVEEGKTIVKNR